MEDFPIDEKQVVCIFPWRFIIFGGERLPDGQLRWERIVEVLVNTPEGAIAAVAVFTDDDTLERYVRANGISGHEAVTYRDASEALGLLKRVAGWQYIIIDPGRIGVRGTFISFAEIVRALEDAVGC